MNITNLSDIVNVFYKKAILSSAKESDAIYSIKHFRGAWYDIKNILQEYNSNIRYSGILKGQCDSVGQISDSLHSSLKYLAQTLADLDMPRSATECTKLSNSFEKHKHIAICKGKGNVNEFFNVISELGEITYEQLWANDIKNNVGKIFDDEVFLAEAVSSFAKTILFVLDQISRIADLIVMDVDISSLKSLLQLESNKIIESDTTYHAFQHQKAINLMDPEDQEDPKAIEEMLQGSYFNI